MPPSTRRFVLKTLAFTAVGGALPARAFSGPAGRLPAPAGRVILTVTGKIKYTNQPGEARFDRAMLEQLGMVDLVTWTPHLEGVSRFTGVPMSALLDYVGAYGDEAVASAIDLYRAAIPVTDFTDHDVLLALDLNGEPMRVRDKGPLWLMYPYAQQPDLDREEIAARSVWQLQQIDIR